MKFNCGPTREEKKARLQGWHDFYAIFPRRVGSCDCRCFEVIERKGTIYMGVAVGLPFLVSRWSWEYRAKGGQG